MGCIFSRCFPRDSLKPSPHPTRKVFELSNIRKLNSHAYEKEPIITSIVPEPPEPEDQSHAQRHIPIYIAIESYHSTKPNEISFEIDDEMKLIEEINSYELRVHHLRSGHSGIISKTYVRLDIETPLRLGIYGLGIIQQCLVRHNVLGAYVIRNSASSPNGFVLTILQGNEQYNTLTWDYLIWIHSSNKCFYFPQEVTLQHTFFSSFRQLINDERVRSVIPLTEILPYSIEFDEKIWNIPFDDLKIEEKISGGYFGEVARANWHIKDRIIPIAVKKLHVNGVNKAVEREIDAMKNLTNLHIISLYGISQSPVTNELLIITEFMQNGDLKAWLKKLPNLPEFSVLLSFAKDIATGMAYLEHRNYVHRDLACRNILLSRCSKKVKIADFGLSTIIDTNDTGRREEALSQKLPTRWLAPELLNDQAAYSIKSDIWAFGIVLIEIWLKGDDPYAENIHAWIQSAVSTGHVHEKPDLCPNDFYEHIICECLKFQANDRPTFSNLRQSLGKWKY
ncbi:unnamed protein product [Adineta steineri]|uniref:Non-specific protein-tyrosine kinase n=3 Tax=Adineta steineri TaxID=433720 RepID=A0A818RMB2_9BILA|nr:unnamed protein product [Adineta steineri]